MVGGILVLGLAASCVYLILVRRLRYRRRDELLTRFPKYANPENLGQMTLDEAFAIQLPLAQLEFPLTFAISIFFAIFKTYGISSISKLLVSTGELSNPESAPRRAADTGVLITEFVLNKPGSERNLAAIARVNWLHDRHRKTGKIKDDDMLYTLSLFALEPVRWTKNLEWRDLTDIERCAMAVYWKNMGEVMSIPYDCLPSAKLGWSNGLQWLAELEEWSHSYEVQNMRPGRSNHKLGATTIDIGLTNVPRFLKPLGLSFVAALLQQRLRKAMMFDEPAPWVVNTLSLSLGFRKWLIRNFFLPRPAFMRVLWFSEADPTTGRYHFEQYVGQPWYIKPTLARRFNFNSWILWLTGGYLPSKDQPQYCPEGYNINELGPPSLKGKGVDEMEDSKLAIRRIQGCPLF